jgi:hypothetical protein
VTLRPTTVEPAERNEIERTVSAFLNALLQGDHLLSAQLETEDRAFFARLEHEAAATDGLKVIKSDLSVERVELVSTDGMHAEVAVIADSSRTLQLPNGRQEEFQDSWTGPVSLVSTEAGWRVADYRPAIEKYVAEGDPLTVEGLVLTAVALKATEHAYWLYLRASNSGTERTALRELLAREPLRWTGIWRDRAAWVPPVEFEPGQSGVIAAWFDPRLRIAKRLSLEAYVGSDLRVSSGPLDVRLTKVRIPASGR